MLRVALGGGVRVEVDGAFIDDSRLGGRQGRRLLARLAWEARPVHRDELADGIWLDTLPRTWERSLSGVITRLRVGLADAGVRGDVITFSDGRYVLVGGGDVRVDVGDAACDVAAAREAERRSELAEAEARLHSALAVLRLPLLPGEDAAWVDVARARHGALLLEALDALADVGVRMHRFPVAEQAAREAVEVDPLREAAHQRLLRTLMAEGDHAAAATAYAACRRVLAEELGVNPSPETEAIYRRALADEPSVGAGPVPSMGSALPRPPFPAALADHVTTLIGREAELVWLWSLWRRARLESPLTVALLGPAGSGRRSVAAVFAREVHASGGNVECVNAVAERSNAPDGPRPTERATATPSVVVVLGCSRAPPRPEAGLVVVVAATDDEAGFDATWQLRPLDRVSVAAMVEERIGREATTDELDCLCAETGGWPGPLVDALSAWATARAAALTQEAARADASLSAIQADLADEIVRSRPRLVGPSFRVGQRAPYKGLVRFEPEDADMFFGREQLVADVLARLTTDRLVVVLGASGSGKSSLVRAGVIAELRRGALAGSDRWPVVLLTPGHDPVGALATCLAAATSASGAGSLLALVDELDRVSPSVVVVDQFEELFASGTGEDDRVAFAAALMHGVVDRRDGGHRVVIVLRSDFFDAASALPGLAEACRISPIIVPPPTEVELRRMVSLPARVAGGVLEPGLVDAVIADSQTSPGALPLVSTAMLESWSRRVGATVTIQSYRAAGGVVGAVGRLAEDVWASFDPAEQRLAKTMLLRLAGDVRDVNNPVRNIELVPSGDDAAACVLDRLVQRRLVTVDDDTVRLAHEALLREWPRFAGWLADDRVVRESLEHLRRASREWEHRDRDDADLYRGTRLAAAIDLEEDVELTGSERWFLEASAERQRSEVRILRRRSRRLRALSAVLIALLGVASLAGAVAVARQREAAEQARLAIAQRLTRDAETSGRVDLGLLLAVEALRLDDSPEARGALVGRLVQSGNVLAILRGDVANPSAVAVNADGTLLATGGSDGRVSVWRLPDDELINTAALLTAPVAQLAFAADGEVAAAGEDGEIARWRPGAPGVARFRAHGGASLAVAYRSDGTLLTAGVDGLLRAFAPTTGEEVWSMSISPGTIAVSFDRSGTRVALLGDDGELAVFDVDANGGRVVRTAADPVSVGGATALALSDDGRTVAVGDRTGGVHVVNPESGETTDIGALTDSRTEGAAVGVEHLAFTPSGELLASTRGMVERFDPKSQHDGVPVDPVPVQIAGGTVTGLAVTPAGIVAVVTESGETLLLDLDRSNLARPLGNTGQLVTAMSVGGDLVAAGGDSEVALLELDGGGRRVLAARGHPVADVATVDGLLAAAGIGLTADLGQPGAATVFDARSGETLIQRLSFFDVTAVALAASGEWSAYGDARGQVRLVEAGGGRVHDLPPLSAATAALRFDPAGEELVALAADGTIVQWTLDGQAVVDPIEVGSPATDLAISPNGTIAAVATADGAVTVDLVSGRIGPAMASSLGRIETVSFGVDGTILATGGSAGLQLWDVGSGRLLGDPLLPAGIAAVAFDPSGRRLVTGGDDGELLIWTIDPDHWVDLACDIAGRPLSREEWHRYLGERTYGPACR